MKKIDGNKEKDLIKKGKLLESEPMSKELLEKLECAQKFHTERKKWEKALFTSKTVLKCHVSKTHGIFLFSKP